MFFIIYLMYWFIFICVILDSLINPYIDIRCIFSFEPIHAGITAIGKALWVFLLGSLRPASETPLQLSEVNLSCGVIFILIKAITQQGANWLIAWAFV